MNKNKRVIKILLTALSTTLFIIGLLLIISAFELKDNQLKNCEYTVNIYEESAQMMYDYNTEIVNDDGSTIDYFNVTCNEYFKLKGWC